MDCCGIVVGSLWVIPGFSNYGLGFLWKWNLVDLSLQALCGI